MAESSKYPESDEPKVSLGPVFAVNPRYIKKIDIVLMDDGVGWLDAYTMGNAKLTTELESTKYVLAVGDALLAANPAIEIVKGKT